MPYAGWHHKLELVRQQSGAAPRAGTAGVEPDLAAPPAHGTGVTQRQVQRRQHTGICLPRRQMDLGRHGTLSHRAEEGRPHATDQTRDRWKVDVHFVGERGLIPVAIPRVGAVLFDFGQISNCRHLVGPMAR